MDPSKTDAWTQNNGRGALQLKYDQIEEYRKALKLSPAVVARAKGLVKQTGGASVPEIWREDAFAVACIFIACREKQEEKNLVSMVRRAGVWIQTAIEALWYLEGLLENPPCNQGISIVWRAMSGPCPYSLYPGARLEATLSWPTHPFLILRGDYSTSSPSLRALRADRVELVAKIRNNTTVDKDWEMIDWKEEDVDGESITEKVVKAGGWAGALRRGLFG
ncbi:hypothetical protein G7Y79_00012g033130 [Physcia stellaris]|nr:hypothetical protein G7Y79_00012g033130 [Physcia stellaris]